MPIAVAYKRKAVRTSKHFNSVESWRTLESYIIYLSRLKQLCNWKNCKSIFNRHRFGNSVTIKRKGLPIIEANFYTMIEGTIFPHFGMKRLPNTQKNWIIIYFLFLHCQSNISIYFHFNRNRISIFCQWR